jgi:hypothetical protein
MPWIDWVSALLSTANSKVLFNGIPGERICHVRGLHQGDPLSPMLFLLVMEILSALIRKVDDWALREPLRARSIQHRAPLYADDLILFVSPSSRGLHLTKSLLSLFEWASGLGYNFAKCQMAPIRCGDDHLALASTEFPCQMVDFPIKHLGIPLSVIKLPKVAFQTLVDQANDNLPTWKGRLMRHSGRLILIKSTLQVIPIYVSISLELPPWVIKALEKIFIAFL